MNKVSLKTGWTLILGQGYEAYISLNGLRIWTDHNIHNNHFDAECVANDKVLDVFKELFNGS